MSFGAAQVEVVAGFLSAPNMDRVAVAVDVLDHDHGVGSFGQRRSGHNLEGFTRADGAAKQLAGADFANHSQIAGQVGRPDRITVAGGAMKRGVVAVGGNGFGEDSARGAGKAHGFGLPAAAARVAEDASAGLFKCEGHIFQRSSGRGFGLASFGWRGIRRI